MCGGDGAACARGISRCSLAWFGYGWVFPRDPDGQADFTYYEPVGDSDEQLGCIRPPTPLSRTLKEKAVNETYYGTQYAHQDHSRRTALGQSLMLVLVSLFGHDMRGRTRSLTDPS